MEENHDNFIGFCEISETICCNKALLSPILDVI